VFSIYTSLGTSDFSSRGDFHEQQVHEEVEEAEGVPSLARETGNDFSKWAK
jgi:hypothetical protein